MVITRSKRAKRIVRWLSSSQEEDQVLTPSVTPLIRYNLLHNYHRCVQVSVNLSDPVEPDPPFLSYHGMPKFLRSQLEAQKIADGTRLWTQIEPVLAFIEANLAKHHRPHRFPTLFLWYSRENHRSYIFFAFVAVKMSSKTYTARELLRMRHVPAGRELYEQLYRKLQKDLELSDIVRMQPGRTLPLIKEESRDTSAGSDENMPPKLALVRQLDGTDSDWKYRGRTDSENAEPQPISAPCGLAAQKDEGFQRFYKAVVSPTHVRVTAGGRIVPNTRGSSSPTGKWSKERVSGDSFSTSRQPSHDQPDPIPFGVTQAPLGSYGPIFQGFAPGMTPGMAAGMSAGPAPFPMMPWHMGFNMGGFGMPPPHLSQASGPRSCPPNAKDSSKSDKQSEAGAPESDPRVRISPPENYDQARPSFYNGQWMMPPGAPFYPYGMPAFHGFPPPHMAGPPVMPHPIASTPAVQPQEPKASQFTQPPAPKASSSSGSSVPSFVPPSKPPVSSIRPSEITKKQIEVLRGSLRYLEDQLQYNKHQIDEKATENQARMVRQQIQQFEKNLEGQVAIEAGRYSRSERKAEAGSSESSQAAVLPRSSATSQTKPESVSYRASVSQDEPAPMSSFGSKRGLPRFSSNINPSKSVSVSDCGVPESPIRAERLKKASSLPFNAALAAPFQPRSGSISPVQAVPETSGYSPRPEENGELIPQIDTSESIGELCNVPYLVGRLPPGVGPAFISDTDYVYDRNLTEDELRARHMYWGKTPRHLQKGLPKFDGKDFYPPSPIRGLSSDVASSPKTSVHRSSEDEDHADGSLTTAKVEGHVFQPLPGLGQRGARDGSGGVTQSESLPTPEHSLPGLPTQRIAQLGRSYEHSRKTKSEIQASTDSTKGKSSSDEGDEDRNLIFKGRRAMNRTGATKTHNEIWQSMLKKGKSSANAVPVTISSMTAQGVLPNYAGHASASLTPSMVNTSVSTRGGSKTGGDTDVRSTAPVTTKTGENRPPAELSLNEPRRGVDIRDGGRKGFPSR